MTTKYSLNKDIEKTTHNAVTLKQDQARVLINCIVQAKMNNLNYMTSFWKGSDSKIKTEIKAWFKKFGIDFLTYNAKEKAIKFKKGMDKRFTDFEIWLAEEAIKGNVTPIESTNYYYTTHSIYCFSNSDKTPVEFDQYNTLWAMVTQLKKLAANNPALDIDILLNLAKLGTKYEKVEFKAIIGNSLPAPVKPTVPEYLPA